MLTVSKSPAVTHFPNTEAARATLAESSAAVPAVSAHVPVIVI